MSSLSTFYLPTFHFPSHQSPATAHVKHNPSRRFIGPTAQDFHAAFGLGSDDKMIGTLESDGVMYAAIQGSVEEIKLRDHEIALLEAWSLEQRAESKPEIEELKSEVRGGREQLSNLPPQ